MHAPRSAVHSSLSKGAVATVVGPVKVELEGLTQSTWNLKIESWSWGAPPASSSNSTKLLGLPAGGSMEPSNSEGSNPPNGESRWKYCIVAEGSPASILV